MSEYTDTIKSPSMTQKITDKERQQNDQELRNLMTDIDELMVEVGLSGDAKAISCEVYNMSYSDNTMNQTYNVDLHKISYSA